MQRQLLITAFAALVALAVVLTATAAPQGVGANTPSAETRGEITQDTAETESEGTDGADNTDVTDETDGESTGEQTDGEYFGKIPDFDGAEIAEVFFNGREMELPYAASVGQTVYMSVEAFRVLTGGEDIVANVGESYIKTGDRAIPCSLSTLDVTVRDFETPCAPVEALAKAAGLDVAVGRDGSVCFWGEATYPEASEVYSADDLYWLSRIIAGEARGEPFLGQLAVGNVVLNRMSRDYFPDDVYGVVFDRRGGIQFTPAYCDNFDVPPPESCILAARLCLEGFSIDSDILYFFNSSIAAGSWIVNNCVFTLSIGAHDFYRDA